MQNLRFTLEYDGSRYNGFSSSGNDCVLERVTSAVFRCTGEITEIFAAVNTEPGVHSKGQTINIPFKKFYDPQALLDSINEVLPQDIALRSVTCVDKRFHASLNLRSCTYQYRISLAKVADLFQRKYVLHIKEGLDIDKMNEIAGYLIGQHDFANFSLNKKSKKSVRNLISLNLTADDSFENLTLSLEADRFLRGMPLILVSTLIQAGLGHLDPLDLNGIFEGSVHAPRPAAAKGLILSDTSYL